LGPNPTYRNSGNEADCSKSKTAAAEIQDMTGYISLQHLGITVRTLKREIASEMQTYSVSRGDFAPELTLGDLPLTPLGAPPQNLIIP